MKNNNDDIFDTDKVVAQMKQAITNRNTVTISELAQFDPLFNESIKVSGVMDPEDIRELADRYFERFSPIHPIVVVSDDMQKVIEVLPPSRVQVPTFNQTIPKDDVLIDTYVNIMTSESQPAHKKNMMEGTLNQAFKVTQRSQIFADKVKTAISLERKASEKRRTGKLDDVKKAAKEKGSTKLKNATKGMEWE